MFISCRYTQQSQSIASQTWRRVCVVSSDGQKLTKRLLIKVSLTFSPGHFRIFTNTYRQQPRGGERREVGARWFLTVGAYVGGTGRMDWGYELTVTVWIRVNPQTRPAFGITNNPLAYKTTIINECNNHDKKRILSITSELQLLR